MKLARRLFRTIGIDQYKLRLDIESPQQQDALNCGAFVALNAWKLAHQQPLSSAPYFTDDGTVMRQALARSIINSSTDWPL